MSIVVESDEEPPTNPPALYTETRGPVTRSKYGWPEFGPSAIPDYYLSQAYVSTPTNSNNGTATYTRGVWPPEKTGDDIIEQSGGGPGSANLFFYVPSGDYDFSGDPDGAGVTVTLSPPDAVTVFLEGGTGYGPTEDSTQEWTLSDIYTTDDLKNDTLAALGDWIPNGGDTGSYSLSASEETFTIQQLRWQIKYHPSPTCYTKIWVQFTETPEGGDPVVTVDEIELPFPSGDVCLNLPNASIDDEHNQMETALTEITPTTNGSIKVELLKYSYLPDYEPTGMSDSGFPE